MWTWVGGSNTVNAKGVYGTPGVAAPTNVPGRRLEVIHRTAVTVETALRYQNAENDTDFADCIRHAICGPL
jgi:hypothetical protein